MRVESLVISRYRSLYEVGLRPGDLTVVVGANNSGKTNLADAIDFLAETYRFGLEVAVGRKGGFENIAHRKVRRTKSPVGFTVEASIPLEELRDELYRIGRQRRRDGYVRVRHAFEFTAKGQAIEADYRVSSETFRLEYCVGDSRTTLASYVRGQPVETIDRKRVRSDSLWRELLFPFGDAGFDDYLKTAARVADTELFVSNRFLNPTLAYFAREMAKTRVYQLVPLEGRRPGVPTPNPDLERHGLNLPAFVAQLRKNEEAWGSVLETMRRVVPGLTDIDTDFTPDRRLTIRFYEEGMGRPWVAEDVSDGTIQTLALLAALFDPRVPFVLIEEPENSIHPWIIRNFVDACRSVVGKQILLTTHSPALMNALHPSEVLVVWRSRGETHATPLLELEPDAEKLWAGGDARVFDLLDSGWIPESVPGPAR